MQTASLELCKELYRVSGHTWLTEDHRPEYVAAPAYDLGYLLRKLPEFGKNIYWHTYHKNWCAAYEHTDEDGCQTLIHKVADTPEDAACELAIELFKQGILPTKDKRV